MSGQSTVLQVVILRDGLLVGTEVFVPGQYTLGSDGACELKLDDASVAAQHARLFFQNGRAAVQDLGGPSGVYVNGHRVTACEIRPVDEVAIGPFSLKVRVLQQKPVQSAPPPEVAALLGAPPPAPPARAAAPARPAPAPPPVAPARPGAVPGTVMSARRLAAVPNEAPTAPAPGINDTVPAAKLRAVDPLEEESRTENVDVSAFVSSPPPARQPAAKAQPAKAPVAKPAARGAEARRGQPQRGGTGRAGPGIPSANDGKGRPVLFLELYWGETRKAARSYKTIKPKKPVIGAHDDNAGMPLWGFQVPEAGFAFARQKGSGFRIAVPPGATLEQRGDDGLFHPMASEQLESAGAGKALTLQNGMAVRLGGIDDMSLVAYVQPAIPRPWANPLKGAPWLLLFLLAMFGGVAAAVIAFSPSLDMPDFTGKTVPPVAVRLIAPEPKKKEEAKKKLEELKKKEPQAKKKEEPVAAKPVPKPPPATPPETQKALKSLEKLSAAGPAMKDLLAAVDKLGAGPGKKDAKNDFKLSGLLGKAPIANAGLGTFGLGGGGQGGAGTKGLEVLRGKGGAGIGALGAGRVGKGAVQGTVGRASTRSIGVQGTIDREAVAKVINSHLSEVSACYERALLKEPGLQGKIVLEWNISTAGIVTTARTKSSSMKSAAVESCILSSLKTWKFPPAKGAGVVISYPFLFNSVGY